MKKEPICVYLPSFTWKTAEEFRIKKAIGNLDCPFPDLVEEALGIIKKAGKSALDPLVEAVEKKRFEDGGRWDNVPEAFAGIGEPAVPVLVKWLIGKKEDHYSTAKAALELIGRPAVPHLLEVITTRNKDARKRVINLLGNAKDDRAIPHLITALSDKNDLVRSYAADALIEYGRPIYPQIHPLLKSDNIQQVCGAVAILPGLDQDQGVADVIPYFTHPYGEVWNAVCDSLRQLKPLPVAEMRQCLSSEDQDVVTGALNVLGWGSDEGALHDAVKLLDHPDQQIRSSADMCVKNIRNHLKSPEPRI
ncbi:MAG: HEAT repeat domain-containing protein [Deltaproteobacteria bacterium]|nr:HEAT repeat domain-containing protein [Deltaproteobacteria bacterium]